MVYNQFKIPNIVLRPAYIGVAAEVVTESHYANDCGDKMFSFKGIPPRPIQELHMADLNQSC